MVSIVMTVYNVGQWLEKAIVSCLNQTYKDIELILVEDCSTDDSKKIINKFIKKDKRVVLVQNKENVGAGKSRKIGIEHSKGEFVITVDGDDYLSKDFIESLVKRQEETDADIVSGGITILNQDGSWKAESFGIKVSEGTQKIKDYGDGKIIFLNNKIVRRSMYETVPYSERRYVEDTPVILPLLYYANKIAYADNAGYYYQQRDSSLCHTADTIKDAVFKGLCAAELVEFFKDKKGYDKFITNNNVYQYIKELKAANPTMEQIEPYKEEFSKLMLYTLNMLGI